MATYDRPLPPWPGAGWTEAWPGFAGTWFGEYPTGRGAPRAQVSGWQCPGCQRCYAPTVRQCGECGPKTLGQRIGQPQDDGCCSLAGCEEAER